MGTIASIDIGVKASVDQFKSGLKKAEVIGTTFATKMTSTLGGIKFTGFDTAFVGLGAGLVGVGAGLAAITSKGLDKIDALSDSAQRIGVTTDRLSELRYAAALTGSSAEDLDNALVKFNQNLGDTSEEGGKAGEALGRLGLTSRALASLTPDQRFLKTVKALESVSNASDKTRLAMDIFGKGGVKILNTLGSGSATLESLAAEARKLGVSVSGVDAAKVGLVKDELDRAGYALEGVQNKLTLALTPAIILATTEFSKLVTTTDTLNGKTAVDALTDSLGHLANAAQVAGNAWNWTTNTITHATGAVLEGAGDLYKSLDPKGIDKTFTGYADSLKDIGKLMVTDAKKTGLDIQKAIEGPTIGDKFKNKLADAKAGLDSAKPNVVVASASMNNPLADSIEKVTDKLKEQIQTFGKTTAEVEVYKLSMLGANKAQLATVVAQSEQLKGLEKTKKAQEELKDFAKGLKEEIKTPQEKLKEHNTKIDDALKAGLITQSESVKAKTPIASETHFAGALELGSTEARSAVLAATTGKSNNGVEVATKQVVQNTANTNIVLNRIVEFFQKPPEFLKF